MKTAVFKGLKPLNLDSQMACLASRGDLLAAGGFDGVARLFRLESRELKEAGACSGLSGWVTCLACGEGGLVAGADSQGNAMAWRGGKPLWSRKALSPSWLRKAAASPDGATLALAGRDGILRLLAMDSGATRAELPIGDDLMALAWSRDGKKLAVGSLRGGVTIVGAGGAKQASFEVPGFFKVVRLQEVGGIRVLEWGPGDSVLAAAGAEPVTGGFVEAIPKVVLLAPDGKVLHEAKLGTEKDGFALAGAWHPEGWLALVVSGQPGSGKLHQVDPGTGKPAGSLAVVNPHGLAFAGADLAFVLTTNANSSGNGRVKDDKGGYRANHSVLSGIAISS